MKNASKGPRSQARNQASSEAQSSLRRGAEQALENNRRALMLGSVGRTFAHDFNNLLGVISNGNHVLQRLCTDNAAVAAVEASVRAVTRGARLTELWHRLSTDRERTDEAIDLRIFLQEMEELAKIIVGRRIQLSLHVAPGVWRVGVEPNQLELSLIALLLNARQAMPDGGQLWIDARNAEAASDLPAGDRVALTVTDDGPGMSHHLATQVFEPYFTTRSEQGASGIGLSQVKAFCIASGGTARVASTEGLGTAVTMLLPAETAGAPDTANGPGADGQSSGPADPNDKGRLLLVEDSDDVAGVTSALLHNHGYRVSRARDADEALRILERNDDIGVVLSDVAMPGETDGVALARQVKTRWPKLPIVLISGQNLGAAVAGSLAVLRKPCAPELLVSTLRREIARTRLLPGNA